MMTILTYLSSLIVLYQEVMMTILTYSSNLIASLVSGGSDDQPNRVLLGRNMVPS